MTLADFRPRKFSIIPEPLVTKSGKMWRLEKEYVYHDTTHNCTITVPAGFRFRASVPRFLWSVFAPEDIGMAAALLHDWLYQWRGEAPIGSVEPDYHYTRQEVDRLLYIASLQGGNSMVYSKSAEWAVRCFGRFCW